MGGELVRRAFAASYLATTRGRPLKTNERLVLLYMASVAHDSDTPPRFWEGRESIAIAALGRTIPQGNDADSQRARESIFKSVRIAVGGLCARGAIQATSWGQPGRNSEFVICVDSFADREFGSEPVVPGSEPHVPTSEPLVPKPERESTPETQTPTHPETPKITEAVPPTSHVDNSKKAA